MLRRAAFVAALCIAAAMGGAAHAASFSSDKLGFSADFPTIPDVGAPEGSEKDDQGKFVSTLVSVASKGQGQYMAAVFVDSFDVPTKVDVTASLRLERDNFLGGMSGTVVESHDSTVGGHAASYFTYDTPDHSAQGEGLVVVIDAEKPKVYFVVTMHTPRADAGEKALLDRFFASFALLPGA